MKYFFMKQIIFKLFKIIVLLKFTPNIKNTLDHNCHIAMFIYLRLFKLLKYGDTYLIHYRYNS